MEDRHGATLPRYRNRSAIPVFCVCKKSPYRYGFLGGSVRYRQIIIQTNLFLSRSFSFRFYYRRNWISFIRGFISQCGTCGRANRCIFGRIW